MLDNEIKNYFDGIEPDNELIERMIIMSETTVSRKNIKLSKRAIAIIVAVVVLIVGTTATATIIRVKNDNSGIVQIDDRNSFILEFSKAQRSPEKLSDTSSDIVSQIAQKGFKDIVIPSTLISDGYKLTNTISFIPQYTSAMFDFSNDSGNSVSMSIVQDISDDDIDGFWGAGDEESTGEVVNVNGMDVVITYMGDSEVGYAGIIFYANGNTIYQITYFGGTDEAQAKQNILDFVNTLAQ